MRWILMAFMVALLGVTPARADEEQCGKCPSCPSSKAIAEQVVEDIDAKPRPTIVHCNRREARQANVGGYLTHCRVFFPTAGTPPLVEE